MRGTATLWIVVLALAAGSAQAADVKKPVAPKGDPPVIEPKAVELLKASSATLAAAKTLAFTAVVYYENTSAYGAPLVYTVKSAVTVQRPDKLSVVTAADGPANDFYLDGKNMTAFDPGSNLAAVAPAPGTIDAALKIAFQSAAIYFPFTDLIVADPYKDLASGLKLAFYIGQSKVVGGTTTDMVAYGNDEVFVQVWIGADDRLPRMVRAVYANDPAQLRNALEITDWKLDAPVAADAFTAKNAAGAGKITFERPDAKK